MRQKILINKEEKSSSDFLFTSDWHLHDRKDLSKIDPVTGLGTRLLEGYHIVDQILAQAKKYVFCLGDVLEIKDRVPNQILITLKNILRKFETKGIKVYILKGNHEFALLDYPTLEIFDESNNPSFVFIDKPKTLVIENLRFGFIPYQSEWKNFKEIWMEFFKEDLDIICFHQYLPGVMYESGKIIEQEEDVPRKEGVIYLSGHAHTCQQVKGVHYLGSPYHFKFGDVGINKYIWFFDPIDKRLIPHKLDYPEFIDLDYKYLENIETVKDQMKNLVEGNYVRVCGEIPEEVWKTMDKRKIKEKVEKLGAKAIIFNIQPIKSLKPKTVQYSKDHKIDVLELLEEFVRENNIFLPEDTEKAKIIGTEIWDNVS